jgi:hypothetical protein
MGKDVCVHCGGEFFVYNTARFPCNLDRYITPMSILTGTYSVSPEVANLSPVKILYRRWTDLSRTSTVKKDLTRHLELCVTILFLATLKKADKNTRMREARKMRGRCNGALVMAAFEILK